jgi:hypothetical protein
MRIVFGTGFYGKVAKLDNQWIETKFFHCFFIPIFPISSMLVTSSQFRRRQGLNISTNKKSVIAVYASMICFAMAAYNVFAMENTYYLTREEAHKALTWHMIKLIMWGAAWVYFFFFYGKVTTAETAIRTKVGKSTGFYALPEWFDFLESKSHLNTYLIRYMSLYPGQDWKADLQEKNISSEKLPLLYAIALFNCMTYDVPENDELYFKADSLFNPVEEELKGWKSNFTGSYPG